MSKKQEQAFSGIVLAIRKHKERDALIKIFTLEHGKKMFFIRNYNKANHPLRNALLPFSHADYIGRVQKDGLSFLQDYKEAENFPLIQNDFYRNAYAIYLANLADAAVEDGTSHPAIYRLLLSSLQSLEKGLDAETVTNIYEMHMLRYFGVHPELAACRICGDMQEPFDYSAKYSGVLCSKHWDRDANRLHAAPAAIHFCRLFLHIAPEQVASINLKEANKQAIRQFIDFLYDEYVGIKLKSKSFIDEMYQWESSMTIPRRKTAPAEEENEAEDAEKD